MSHPNAPGDDQRALAEALQQMGAIVALSKSGRLLRVDFRPAILHATDATMQMMAHSTKLKELRLERAPITENCIDSVLTLESLSVLDVQYTVLDDSAIERLATLPNLSMLLVRGSKVTPECVRLLRRRLTKVRIVG
jgi:hypothetical protein